jgi:hypothetical protein
VVGRHTSPYRHKNHDPCMVSFLRCNFNPVLF